MPNILIAGGTGLIGSHLSKMLAQKGHQVMHLSRQRDMEAVFPAYRWDLKEQFIEEEAIRKADYVINLAGAGIADGRWSEKRKKIIIDSRVKSAELLFTYFKKLETYPKAYISSSAVGYYGDRGDELLTETSEPGEGFLSESCIAWEKAAQKAEEMGIRTVIIRTGIVLSTQGGAMEKMLTPLTFFTSAYFGDGKQWYPWIHIDDIARIYLLAIEDDTMKGIYNGVAPEPVTNKTLAGTLASASGKPALIAPVPAFILRSIFGEMADTILGSNRVSSEKIERQGIDFKFPELPEALQDLMDRKV